MKTVKTLDELENMKFICSEQTEQLRSANIYKTVSVDKDGTYYQWDAYDMDGEFGDITAYIDPDEVDCETVKPYTETIVVTKYRSVD